MPHNGLNRVTGDLKGANQMCGHIACTYDGDICLCCFHDFECGKDRENLWNNLEKREKWH